MAGTPTTQRNTVSEGMALGLLMCGRDELPRDPVMIDLAFETEFPVWRHASRFPQVVTDLRNGLNGRLAITRADERKAAWHLFWCDDEWPPYIAARPRWDGIDIDPHEIAASIDRVIPAAAWAELAGAFLEHFPRPTG